MFQHNGNRWIIVLDNPGQNLHNAMACTYVLVTCKFYIVKQFPSCRHTALRCGLNTEIPALTVNRLCGSGFQAIVNAVQEILVGDADVVLTGGSDNMSACPYAVRDIR